MTLFSKDENIRHRLLDRADDSEDALAISCLRWASWRTDCKGFWTLWTQNWRNASRTYSFSSCPSDLGLLGFFQWLFWFWFRYSEEEWEELEYWLFCWRNESCPCRDRKWLNIGSKMVDGSKKESRPWPKINCMGSNKFCWLKSVVPQVLGFHHVLAEFR